MPPESDNQAARPDLTAVPTVRWLPRPTPLTQSEAKTEAQMKRYEEPVPGAKRPMVMVPIRGGRFRMGTPPSEPGRKADEGPQHEVEIEPFWIGRFEVTKDQLRAWFGNSTRRPVRTRSGFDPEERYVDAVTGPSEVPFSYSGPPNSVAPGDSVSHLAAAVFCKWLSGQTGRYYRLPTEAEWEYACRAGTTTAYSFGDDPDALNDYAWHFDSADRPQPVGTRRPNPWGLFDMHGNLAEWVIDGYAADFYATPPQGGGTVVVNPIAVPRSTYPCVLRGGSWDDDPPELRSGARSRSDKEWDKMDPMIPPDRWTKDAAYYVGLRVARPLRVPDEAECQRLESWIARDLAPPVEERPAKRPDPLLDPTVTWLPKPVPLPAAKAKTEAEMKPYRELIPGTGVGFDMVPIRGGTYQMGSSADEPGRQPDEGPRHAVRLDPFWMGKCEVTWDEFTLWVNARDYGRRLIEKREPTEHDRLADAVTHVSRMAYTDATAGMGFEGCPAICMTQVAAKLYCKWLSAKTGRYYRLPTEAEWEYACRAGTTGTYSFGDETSKLDEYAWYRGNSGERYHPVGRKKPNPWGLYDMHGNVAEWVVDQYVPDFYARFGKVAAQNSFAPVRTRYPCVVRGGSWDDEPPELRSAARRASSKEYSAQDPQEPQSLVWHTDSDFVGFRVVRPLRQPSEAWGKALEVNRKWIEDYPGK